MHKSSKDKHFADRIKSILSLDKGYSYEEIADHLLLDDGTIRRWHETFVRGGIKELLGDDYQGSEPYLSEFQQKELDEYLQQHICLSAKEVCDYVEKKYEITYTFKGMTSLLHRLNFSYKKPKHKPSKADRALQEVFTEQYGELKKNKKDDDKIYFVDGVHPLHNAQLGYGWIKKGKEQFVPANTGRNRVNINGAYDIAEHKVIVNEDKSVNAQSTLTLIQKIMVQQTTGMIYLINDNAKYYYCKEVQEFLAINPRVKMIFLPAYSPNLNLIVPLFRDWRWLKKNVCYNKYYEKFSAFKEKILERLENLANYREEMEKLMTENFQLFPT